jgi:hypothetical protein
MYSLYAILGWQLFASSRWQMMHPATFSCHCEAGKQAPYCHVIALGAQNTDVWAADNGKVVIVGFNATFYFYMPARENPICIKCNFSRLSVSREI